jgi:hypothetical protein
MERKGMTDLEIETENVLQYNICLLFPFLRSDCSPSLQPLRITDKFPSPSQFSSSEPVTLKMESACSIKILEQTYYVIQFKHLENHHLTTPTIKTWKVTCVSILKCRHKRNSSYFWHQAHTKIMTQKTCLPMRIFRFLYVWNNYPPWWCSQVKWDVNFSLSTINYLK